MRPLKVSPGWLTKVAALEEGHDISAGSEEAVQHYMAEQTTQEPPSKRYRIYVDVYDVMREVENGGRPLTEEALRAWAVRLVREMDSRLDQDTAMYILRDLSRNTKGPTLNLNECYGLLVKAVTAET